MPAPTDFVAHLRGLARPRRTLLVGIDGCGGAGKSTFARSLAAVADELTVIEFDDFYRPSSERPAYREEIGGSFDWRRLRELVLLPLAADEPARYRRYDWPSDALAEWHVVPAGGIVVVEGNYSTRSELFHFYDLTVWVDAPSDVRLERGVRRGGENTRERWLSEWMPEEERYVATEDPASRVDVVLDGNDQPGAMTHDRSFVREVVEFLAENAVTAHVFGGWAEELHGACAPRAHADVDLLVEADDFTRVDELTASEPEGDGTAASLRSVYFVA
jgi:uridine kinase